jgi:hypothetical protein
MMRGTRVDSSNKFHFSLHNTNTARKQNTTITTHALSTVVE